MSFFPIVALLQVNRPLQHVPVAPRFLKSFIMLDSSFVVFERPLNVTDLTDNPKYRTENNDDQSDTQICFGVYKCRAGTCVGCTHFSR